MANPQPDQYTALSNELLEALIKQKLSGREFRVFMAIVRLTYGWKRKTHPIALSELSEITGIERSHTANVIKTLIDKNMVLRNGVTGIQKDYHKWVLPNPVTDGVTENGNKSVTENGNKSVTESGNTLISKEKKEKKESEFESLWTLYPRKLGRADAFRHFKAQVLNGGDYESIKTAIQNYVSYIERQRTEERFVKHGSTFFNADWKDWVNYSGQPSNNLPGV